MIRVAVVGHVEWSEFAQVERVPAPGQIVSALESWREVAGGGAVAAVQLAKLAGECLFLTALGDDCFGHAAKGRLGALGVDVRATTRSEPQRRAFVYIDADGERTITTIGERLGPRGEDPLPWAELNAPTPSISRLEIPAHCGRHERRASWSPQCALGRWRGPE